MMSAGPHSNGKCRMGASRRTHVLAAATLAFLLAPIVDAQAEEFRIRKATLEGNHLLLYHEPVDGSGPVSVHVGGQPCDVVEGEIQKPNRGGDQLTTLIVIDRGGTKRSDMGLWSPPIIAAVQQFIAQTLQNSPSEKFAIKEAPGSRRQGAEHPPSNNAAELDDFLNNLGEPAGAGADIYGTTRRALSLLDATDTKLRAVIMISDGMDPMRKTDTATHQDDLVASALEKGVPLSAIHIDRSSGLTAGKATRGGAKRGAGLLAGVVEKTHGEFRTEAVGQELQERVLAALKGVAGVYETLVRTQCKLCGNLDTARRTPVEMVVGEGVAGIRSRSEPPMLVNLPATNFGSCSSAPGAPPAPTPACESGNDCTDRCQECVDGACESPECEEDATCFEGCSCQDGNCKKAKTLADHIPLIAGILGILLALLIGVSLSRRQKRSQAALQADIASREERTRADAQAARKRADEEAQRHAAEQAKMEMRLSEQKGKVEALAEQLNPVFYRLVSADGSGAVNLEVRKGTQAIGGDAESCALVIDQPTVSGHHATLSVDDQGVVTLTDESSSNHTYVNDFQLQPHAPVEVRPGDMIALSRNVVVTLTEP